jgi:hypothetical protein
MIYANNVSHVYSNSVLIASSIASVKLKTINDVNNWLGRSQWNDPVFQGKFNEVRIWNGVLTAANIAAAYAAGPDTLPSESTDQPKLSVSLTSGKVMISWPGPATAYQVQSTLQLGANASWMTVDTWPPWIKTAANHSPCPLMGPPSISDLRNNFVAG